MDVIIEQPGFRSKKYAIATTILDTEIFTRAWITDVYRSRWLVELDFRSLKQTMQMDILRCKTPELVRKEIWTHVLAYNLIRTILVQAASKHDIEPRTISFKGAVQAPEAFQPLLAMQGARSREYRRHLYHKLLEAVATHRVADRPDRFEPRQRKRRQKKYDRMMKPRNVLKREMLKRLTLDYVPFDGSTCATNDDCSREKLTPPQSQNDICRGLLFVRKLLSVDATESRWRISRPHCV